MHREDIYKVENQQLVLDKEYIRGIPEFRVILERRLVGEGDSDGRRKKANWQLFFYIKIVADLFSYPNQGGNNEKDVHKAACKEAGFEESYRPDKEVLLAIEKYRTIQLESLPVMNTISTMLKALKTTDAICQGIIGNINAKLEAHNKKLIDNEKNGMTFNIADEQLLIDGLVGQITQVNKLANTIPDTVELLSKLDERLKKESSGNIVGRGGKEIGRRAIPRKEGRNEPM